MGTEPFDQDDLPVWIAGDPWERQIRELLDRMDREVDAVVVEGPNDKAALREGGVTVPVFECSSSSGLDTFARRLPGQTIVILTDYDTHGRRLNGQLRDLLSDARIESRWRRDLGLLLTKRGRYDIESLNNVFGL